jgi:fatty-acid desaturase
MRERKKHYEGIFILFQLVGVVLYGLKIDQKGIMLLVGFLNRWLLSGCTAFVASTGDYFGTSRINRGPIEFCFRTGCDHPVFTYHKAI